MPILGTPTSAKEKRLQLVGSQTVLVPNHGIDAVIQFYGPLFARLRTEVKHTGSLTRHVGFQCRLDPKNSLHFLGMEVEKIETIPPGMIAWELGENRWTRWQNDMGKDVGLHEESIIWQWLDPSPGPGHRTTGEFTASGPLNIAGNTFPGPHDYWLSMHSYWSPTETEVGDDTVSLADYDPSWPAQYEEFADWIRDLLGSDVASRVGHYGSTAIPGMPAKPIIDILVEIPSFPEAKRRAIPLLNRPEWEYCWYSDHMMFIRRHKLMGRRTHHVHMAPANHDVWMGIAFRDYLRSHTGDASRYAALKKDLATKYRDDRERYTAAKSDFIRTIAYKIST